MNTSHPTSDLDLNAVLQNFVNSLHGVLGENIIGVYLQGSFAVGDSDTDSDVDFLVALDHEVPEPDMPALQAMHARIYHLASPWAQHLEGSYFPKELLRQGDPTRTPLLFLDNTHESLIESDHDNTLVVR